ncbi:RusA family crossover junction endodeoxyribonuclease [Erwinia sp. CPCC 100877]|nr:RusA family crossover junction endodeoxyribonuclease [Erwinia sp. CPCC 100877]
MKIIIPGELTDLNKFINSQRANRFGGNALKRQNTQKCRNAFLLAKAAGFKVTPPVRLKITWFCKNMRKDPDNVTFAKKFILDGMQESGVIANDGFKQIKGFSDDFKISKDNPRIEIEVEEI